MSRIAIKDYAFLWNKWIKQVLEVNNKSTFISRLYCQENKTDKSEKEDNLDSHSATYEDTSVEYGIGKKYAIMKLQQLFDLRLFIATDIASRFKKLQLVTGKTMSDNYKILKQEGIKDEVILQYPDLLAQRLMEEKIQLVKNLSYSFIDTVPLLNIELNKLKQFMNKQYAESKDIPGGRIGFYSRTFELLIFQTCDILAKRPFLQNIDLKKVENNCKVLIEFGIELNDIKKDYWVLRYSTDIIKQRLQTLKCLDVVKLKTWMVRAQPEVCNNYVQRRNENKSILGENSLAEYLSERLECPLQRSKHILARHPALLGKSMRKMKEIIDFLCNDGYTPTHIARNPKVLLHSVETTRKRLKELEEQGVKVDSLHILTKSQKQYMNYYENLIKSNKNKMQDKN